MPPRKKATPKVDPTVENQESPGSSEEVRPSTETTNEPEVPELAPANKVDETVVNQENPGTSETERPSTEEPTPAPETPKVAPAHEVDETVVNQESPGSGEFVDRNPEPQIVEDSAGIAYDVSKPYPELVTSDPETEQRRARVRHESGALDAKDIEGADDDKKEESKDRLEIYFLETGLTAQSRVWKAGQTLVLEDNEETRKGIEDTEGNVWYDLSAEEQKKRYGKVFFEKR